MGAGWGFGVGLVGFRCGFGVGLVGVGWGLGVGLGLVGAGWGLVGAGWGLADGFEAGFLRSVTGPQVHLRHSMAQRAKASAPHSVV